MVDPVEKVRNEISLLEQRSAMPSLPKYHRMEIFVIGSSTEILSQQQQVVKPSQTTTPQQQLRIYMRYKTRGIMKCCVMSVFIYVKILCSIRIQRQECIILLCQGSNHESQCCGPVCRPRPSWRTYSPRKRIVVDCSYDHPRNMGLWK